jgi:hypothetical protein
MHYVIYIPPLPKLLFITRFCLFVELMHRAHSASTCQLAAVHNEFLLSHQLLRFTFFPIWFINGD